MNNELQDLNRDINSLSVSIIKELENKIKNYLDKCGLFYKVFSRMKSSKSIKEKVEDRKNRGIQGYKIQDLVGIRIVLYFKNDIELCEKLIKQYFDVVNVSKDIDAPDKFKAQRINYVCRLPKDIINNFDDKIWDNPIDSTFEIQIRTIFSEGWHEIEHDFRYKCKEDWNNYEDLSRILNGIFATLENCDWTISSLLTQIAYQHYKNSEWVPMLKNTFKMRIVDSNNMDDVLNYFNSNKDVAKLFYRIDREDFLLWLSELKIRVPLNLKNLVLLVNIHQIKDEYINSLMPQSMKDIIEE